MGDSQDFRDDVETTSIPGAAPSMEPTGDAAHGIAAQDLAHEEAIDDAAGHAAGLTGALEALGEPEPIVGEADDVETVPADMNDAIIATEPAEDATDSAEDEPLDSEIAALQADLEAGEATEEVAAVEPEEVAAAEAESAEQPSESLGDIAPGTVGGVKEASEDARDLALPDDRAGIPIWPFLAYFGCWVVFAGLLVWQFIQAPAGTPVYELQVYGISILVGLVLTAMGPLLAIAVWLAVWQSRPGARAGLFSRSLIIGAVTTLAGVALWLLALGAVDMLRLGRLL
jgi:hypothetical protein